VDVLRNPDTAATTPTAAPAASSPGSGAAAALHQAKSGATQRFEAAESRLRFVQASTFLAGWIPGLLWVLFAAHALPLTYALLWVLPCSLETALAFVTTGVQNRDQLRGIRSAARRALGCAPRHDRSGAGAAGRRNAADVLWRMMRSGGATATVLSSAGDADSTSPASEKSAAAHFSLVAVAAGVAAAGPAEVS